MSDEVEISKYRIVYAPTLEKLEVEINLLVTEGYRFISQITEHHENFAVIMGLRSTPDLQMARDFVNVTKSVNDPKGSPLIAKMLQEGWVAVANYQKEVALMKVK